jgi:LmbE family N-acetylglucosaminyl deacetylase
VLLARPEARPHIEAAARVLGVRSTTFLDFAYGEVQPDVSSKMKLVRLFRELRPDLLITQDPEHSYHDLDPDRRLAMLLYLEAIALAGRDWREAECGGFAPHTISDLYYMTPESPNCVVEIGATFARKQQALNCLGYQLEYTAQVMKQRLGDKTLKHILPNYEGLRGDDLELGRALHHEMDKALAMSHGILSHSGAGMAEAFRRQGPFRLERLL